MLRRLLPMLVVALASRAAWAEDDRAACIASADAGQNLRDHHKLVAARERFVACASEACPAAIRKDCIQWQSDVESRTPTVVFVARDERGNDLAAVKVSADDKPIAQRLDGTSVSMDPGEHTVVFASPGRQPARLNVIIREGEKNRQVQAVLLLERPAAPPAAAVPTSSGGSLVPAIAVGAAGVLVLGGSLALGLTGRSDVAHLRDTCAGHCAESDVDSARKKLVFADIGLGISVIAFGLAAYLALARTPAASSHAASASAR